MENQSQNGDRQIETRKESGDVSSLVLFNRNSHFAYVYRKTEKLVTAVYMITNFIKDNEPLKWKIRENALSLMALNISFNTVSLAERKDLIKEYQGLSLEIVSLASIAHHSGLISEMNYSILSREFTALLSLMEKDENRKGSEDTVMLDPGFFDIASPKVAEREAPLSAPAVSEAPKADAPRVLYTPPATAPKGQTISVSSKPEYLPLKDIKEKQPKATDSKDGRQAIIVKLLSKRSGLNVNDFVESIKGVSVKTIQRELLAMVAAGTLKKEGERRWSTYSLNK
ncbi:MAG: hypothetical protein HZA81_03965 [Candidatus Taylorbacteria bacterium]|nr:hypothetical protein [Candidatus Taylorbacteria bacterium]